MKKTPWIAGAALLLAAWTASAQPNGAPPQGPGDYPPQGDNQPQETNPPPLGRSHHRPPPLPIVLALDTNGDGIIDAAEIANAPAALKKLDKNGDGQLTWDEYMPPRPGGTNGPPRGRNGRKPPIPPIVAALDTNGDGIIDASEIANASASLLKLDKNGDGKLTPDEYLPPRRPPPDREFDGPPGGPPDGPPPGEAPDGGGSPPNQR
jgi:hypothetical protein